MNVLFLEMGNAVVHLSIVKMFTMIALLEALVACFHEENGMPRMHLQVFPGIDSAKQTMSVLPEHRFPVAVWKFA